MASPSGKCRACGCTDKHACWRLVGGAEGKIERCAWVPGTDHKLCTACEADHAKDPTWHRPNGFSQKETSFNG